MKKIASMDEIAREFQRLRRGYFTFVLLLSFGLLLGVLVTTTSVTNYVSQHPRFGYLILVIFVTALVLAFVALLYHVFVSIQTTSFILKLIAAVSKLRIPTSREASQS